MHTVKRVCTLVLTGLLALPMAAPAGAAAASFSDLPSSHWAYIAMTEAAGYGILQGTGANTMSPSAPLTWPQFLAMAARAFAPEEYARSAASGAAWDQAGLDAARSAGLLEGLDEAEVWTGMRPSTPAGPPMLGRAGYPNLWMNLGQGSLGFTLAAGSAVVLGALIDNQMPDISLEGLTWKQTA